MSIFNIRGYEESNFNDLDLFDIVSDYVGANHKRDFSNDPYLIFETAKKQKKYPATSTCVVGSKFKNWNIDFFKKVACWCCHSVVRVDIRRDPPQNCPKCGIHSVIRSDRYWFR